MKSIIIFPIFLVSFISILVFVPDMHGPKYTWSHVKGRISTLEMALEMFERDNGRIPTDKEGLEALTENPQGSLKNWVQYLRILPADRWDNEFLYKTQETAPKGYIIYSLGPNFQDENGGVGDISNIQTEYSCVTFDDCFNVELGIFYLSIVTCIISLLVILVLFIQRVTRLYEEKGYRH